MESTHLKSPFVSRLAYELSLSKIADRDKWIEKLEAQNDKLTEANSVLVDKILELKGVGFTKVDVAPVNEELEFGVLTEAAIEEHSGGDRMLREHLEAQAKALQAASWPDDEIAQAIERGAGD